MIRTLFLLLLAAFCHCQDVSDAPSQVSAFNTVPYKPAFAAVIPNQDGSNYYLGYSSFYSAAVSDSVLYATPGKSGSLLDGYSASNIVSTAINWPNEVQYVPNDVFNGLYVWSIAAGFFMGNAQDGGLYAVDMTDMNKPGDVVKISGGDGELWYYHRVEWIDMDGDGDKDALTARAYGQGNMSQLIWFENPNLDIIVPSWEPHVLTEGKVDISFCLANLPNSDKTTTTAIIGAGFWGQELTVTWSETDDWTDMNSIQQITIDSNQFNFDVEFTDVNNDGENDILLTTWSQPPDYPGSVLTYEVPENWKTSAWSKHVLQNGFKLFRVYGKGSPGTAKSFHPSITQDNEKAYIMVSGDDDGKAYVLVPDSEDVSDWSYTMTTIFDSDEAGGVMGQIGQGDVDGDGYMDFFLPAFTMGEIYTMTYRP